MNAPMVSIICNVYNHEKYIREALDSFVMQKTDFAYEVLVHDDASTDHSAEIIREYEKRFPDIIKPVYQTINQYSKCNITLTYQIPRVKGKYIALCEGDDFWNDPYKLQKQFDEMEKHPEIDECAHSAYVLRGSNIVSKIAPANVKTVLDTERVILGDGAFFATNSLFFRTSMYEKIPEFYRFYGIDYTLQIWGSLRGGVLYLPDYMSTYRIAVKGSWSDRIEKDKTRRIMHLDKMTQALQLVDTCTNGRYHAPLMQKKAEYGIDSLRYQHRYHDIRHGEYSQYYKKFSLQKKYRVLANQFLHWIGVKP